MPCTSLVAIDEIYYSSNILDFTFGSKFLGYGACVNGSGRIPMDNQWKDEISAVRGTEPGSREGELGPWV